jgi:hypothetical protein
MVNVLPQLSDPQTMKGGYAENFQSSEDDLIPTEHRQAVDKATQIIRGCMQDIARHIFQVGQELTSVKQLLGRGRFGLWLQREFSGSERLAEHWMNVHQRLGTKAELFAKLQPTALYYLAMPSTPAEALLWVEQKIMAGQLLGVKQVKAIIEACKDRQKHQEKTNSNRRAASDSQETVVTHLQGTLMTVLKMLSGQTSTECQWALGGPGVRLLSAIRADIALLICLVETEAQSTQYGQSVTAPGWMQVRGELAMIDVPQVFEQNAVLKLPDIEKVTIIDADTSSGDEIVSGCTVYVKEGEENQEACYTIIEDETGDPDQGRINCSSPVAKALLGKRVGEIAIAHTPEGDRYVLVTKIQFSGRSLA